MVLNATGRGRAAVLLLLLLATIAVQPGTAQVATAAQPAGLTMNVTAGYDGHYKLGEWFPVQVTLNNTGASLDAEVRVEAHSYSSDPISTFVYPVALPAPARKQVTLYTYASSYQHELHVRLLQGDRVLLQQNITVDPLSDAFLLGVISDVPDLLNALTSTNLGSMTGAGSATLAHLAPESLPASAALLSGLDGLVFAATDSGKLSAEQRRAVAGWVLNGGTLVVAGGGASPATTAGLADLLPVELTGSGPLASLDGLGTYVGGTAPPGGALAAQARLRTGIAATVLVESAGGPLLAVRPLGHGQVFSLGLDPSVAPFKNWDLGTSFWTRVFSSHTMGPSLGGARRAGNGGYPGPYGGFSGPSYYSQFSPFDLPSLQLPSIGLVGGFLFFYVLAVGPLNYLILRRRRRGELAWLTIPVVILLFVGIAYALGYGTKGTQVRLTAGTIVRTYPGVSVGLVDSFVGIFSPTRDAYDLSFAGDTALSELETNGYGGGSGSTGGGGSPVVYQGKPTRVGHLQIDTWALRGFLAEATVPYESPFAVQAELRQGRITGQLTNRGSVALRDVGIGYGDVVQVLGTLPPGGQATVDLSAVGATSLPNPQTVIDKLIPNLGAPQNYQPPANDAERVARRRASLLSSALTQGGLLEGGLNIWIAGWSDTPPLEVSVPGQAPVRDDLILITGQAPLEQGSGAVSLNPAMIPRTLIAGNVESRSDEQGPLLEVQNDAVFEFRLPPDMRIDTLTLDYVIENSPPGGSTDFQVYNWRSQNWEPVTGGTRRALPKGRSYNGPIADPAAHIGDGGRVQLRAAGPSGGYLGSVRRLDLSAEGQR
ncbi:MAG TPA: hypothetical protein VM536_15525 [Chloroflexia bacterium]|nr:hypothetical protein [Chloroflexia bacterium]